MRRARSDRARERSRVVVLIAFVTLITLVPSAALAGTAPVPNPNVNAPGPATTIAHATPTESSELETISGVQEMPIGQVFATPTVYSSLIRTCTGVGGCYGSVTTISSTAANSILVVFLSTIVWPGGGTLSAYPPYLTSSPSLNWQTYDPMYEPVCTSGGPEVVVECAFYAVDSAGGAIAITLNLNGGETVYGPGTVDVIDLVNASVPESLGYGHGNSTAIPVSTPGSNVGIAVAGVGIGNSTYPRSVSPDAVRLQYGNWTTHPGGYPKFNGTGVDLYTYSVRPDGNMWMNVSIAPQAVDYAFYSFYLPGSYYMTNVYDTVVDPITATMHAVFVSARTSFVYSGPFNSNFDISCDGISIGWVSSVSAPCFNVTVNFADEEVTNDQNSLLTVWRSQEILFESPITWTNVGTREQVIDKTNATLLVLNEPGQNGSCGIFTQCGQFTAYTIPEIVWSIGLPTGVVLNLGTIQIVWTNTSEVLPSSSYAVHGNAVTLLFSNYPPSFAPPPWNVVPLNYQDYNLTVEGVSPFNTAPQAPTNLTLVLGNITSIGSTKYEATAIWENTYGSPFTGLIRLTGSWVATATNVTVFVNGAPVNAYYASSYEAIPSGTVNVTNGSSIQVIAQYNSVSAFSPTTTIFFLNGFSWSLVELGIAFGIIGAIFISFAGVSDRSRSYINDAIGLLLVVGLVTFWFQFA
jgi:hypothetical protein